MLKIETQNKGFEPRLTKPGKRLFLTSDGKQLVSAGDPRAAVLYCTEHTSVLSADYKRLTKIKTRKLRKKATKTADASGGVE